MDHATKHKAIKHKLKLRFKSRGRHILILTKTKHNPKPRHTGKLHKMFTPAVLVVAATFIIIGANPANAVTPDSLGYGTLTYVPVVHEVPQTITVAPTATQPVIARDQFTIMASPKPKLVKVAAPYIPIATGDIGEEQAYAQSLLASMGMGNDQFTCLVQLWDRESGWRANAYNASSSAGGIPQALPASKMAAAGADWATNADTQIRWGVSLYIIPRYGTPCGAWAHSQANGWY